MTPDVALRVKPLTKETERGELYQRRPEVQLQLELIAAVGGRIDLAALEIREREENGFIYDETLVYLIRQAFDDGDDELHNALYTELDRRTCRLLGKFKRYFENDNLGFEDFKQDTAMGILKKITNTGSDAADYAQVNYGDFAVRIANDVCRGFLRRFLQQPDLFGDLVRDGEGSDEPMENKYPAMYSRIDDQLVAREAISNLPENIRIAAIMHYLDGWQIESNSPSVGTISGYFCVTPRTIRNWLTQAEKVLKDYRDRI